MTRRPISADIAEAAPVRRRPYVWGADANRALSLRSDGFWRDALLRRVLAVADVFAAVLAAISAGIGATGDLNETFWALVYVPAWILLAKFHGLYDRDHRTLRHLTADEIPSVVVWAISGTAGLILFLSIAPGVEAGIGTAIRAAVTAFVAAVVFRSLARAVWRRSTPAERVLVVGEGPLADATKRKIELFRDMHVAVVAERPRITADDLACVSDWLSDVDRLILASATINEDLIGDLVAICRRDQVKLSIVPPARGMFGTAVQLSHVADLPIIEYNTWDVSRSTLLLKRVLDIAVSSVLLLVLAPLFLLIALAIRIESRGGVFFRQARVGLGGHRFRIYKFRTMVSNAEQLLSDLVSIENLREPMFKLPNDPRVTRVGRVLRKTSLDELPQLLNVLKGEMSLVGPRPEQVELVERYAPEHMFRLAVRPGLTGPMQVFGRGQLAFEERLSLEREYVENLSLRRDFRILLLTVAAVLGRTGAY